MIVDADLKSNAEDQIGMTWEEAERQGFENITKLSFGLIFFCFFIKGIVNFSRSMDILLCS